ncbi:MAG: hypothetical protein ACXW18_04845 [Pyrinomonadaceae bacterium]
MQFFDPNNPNEKKKMIAAGVLALVAIIVLGYVFFGGGSSKPATNQTTGIRPSPSPRAGIERQGTEPPEEEQSIYTAISVTETAPPYSEANRNIFAYYIPPSPTPKLVYVPTPSPTPTPPLTASSLAPASVYARTADFSLQLMGDKFTSAVKIVLDGRELPTRFVNAQQLFATVPASFIANPGVRQVMARSSDGTLYSNTLTLNITPPPTPNFTYVGIIGKRSFNDTAVLQDKGSKEFIRVQRGDPVGGRFRVVSISEKEIKVIDTALKITHTLAFTADQSTSSPFRPPVRSADDEPM